MEYNTQRPGLILTEYGRSMQKMVDKVTSVPDRELRSRLSMNLINVMINLNPGIKDLDNYKQKLWDHLHIMSGFKLDIDGPFPKPEPEELNRKPETIPYNNVRIKFRFYGRNLQYMVDRAVKVENSEIRQSFINMIASFMTNSSRNWNNENLTPEMITEHLKTLSGNTLKLNSEDLNIHVEKDIKRNKNHFRQGNNRNNKYRNKGNRGRGKDSRY
ncbi:MAG: DUF4290 domain-containing protein [Flavobacteriales bacterium]|nr:DUF4290 domain-containing protein [Flavobacteriales bacterium]